MKKDIIKNIRNNNIKAFIPQCLSALVLDAMSIYALFTDSIEKTWFIFLILGGIGGLMTYFSIKTLILICDPYKSDIFKKYGSVNELEKILDDIENNIEYEDEKIVVSKEYVTDKNDFEKLLAYKDILRVHKLVHKTNFVVDRYDLVITDKYNQEISYSYAPKDEQKVDNLLLYIGSKCDNAKLGYTNEAQKHINDNKVELPKSPEQEAKEKYEINKSYVCPECKEKIEEGDRFCKNCGCKIDWT